MTQGTLTRGRLAEHPLWSRALASPEMAGRLVAPLVVSEAVEDRERVDGAGGVMRLSITEAVRDARSAAAAGLAGVLVLGASGRKDESALLASQRDHVVVRAIRAIKDAVPDLAVATEACVCAYTAHGQCVLFAGGGADIAATLERLAEIAVVRADAGTDLILPTGMLDGTVAALRASLAAGHDGVPLAAMVKVESALYRGDRIATDSVPVRERAVPLLDASDRSAAQARARRDVEAGADAVAVTPGVLALDLVARLAADAARPVISIHTADEHALFGVESDADGDAAEREALGASRRAGADLVISYGALARILA